MNNKGIITDLIKDMESLKSTKLYEASFKAIEDCVNLAYLKLDSEEKLLKDFFEHLKSEVPTYKIGSISTDLAVKSFLKTLNERK
jgi:hypothetical protein